MSATLSNDELRVELSRLRARQDAYLAALHDTAIGLLGTLDIDRLLEAIVRHAAVLAGTEEGYLYLVTADERDLELRVSVSGADDLVSRRVLKGGGLVGRVWESGQPLVVADYESWEGKLEITGRSAFHAALGVPLTHGGRVVGVLGLIARDPARHLGPSDIEAVSHFAELASIALQNARLLDKERRARAEAETLQAATQVLSATLDLDDVFTRILTELRRVVPHSSASVQELRGDEFVIIGGHGFERLEDVVGVRINARTGDTPNRVVLETKKPLILEDAQALYAEFRKPEHEKAAVRAWMGIPLLVGDRLIGMITVERKEAGFYDDAHARLAMAFATQAAIAIENARLYSGMQRELHEKTVAQAELFRAKEAALAATRAKSAFLATMSHELRTPLTAILGYTEMLADNLATMKPEEARADLAKVSSAGNHLLRIIDDILDMSRIEAEKMDLRFETFPVRPVISAVSAEVESLLKKNRNAFDVSGELSGSTVYGDPVRLRQVLYNLLSNAAKFTEAGRVSLRVGQVEDEVGRWCLLHVSDTGIGISEEEQGQLFRPFTQGDSSSTRKYGGTGIGLTISRRLCQLLGGDLTVVSELRKGSTFTVRLPASARVAG